MGREIHPGRLRVKNMLTSTTGSIYGKANRVPEAPLPPTKGLISRGKHPWLTTASFRPGTDTVLNSFHLSTLSGLHTDKWSEAVFKFKKERYCLYFKSLFIGQWEMNNQWPRSLSPNPRKRWPMINGNYTESLDIDSEGTSQGLCVPRGKRDC